MHQSQTRVCTFSLLFLASASFGSWVELKNVAFIVFQFDCRPHSILLTRREHNRALALLADQVGDYPLLYGRLVDLIQRCVADRSAFVELCAKHQNNCNSPSAPSSSSSSSSSIDIDRKWPHALCSLRFDLLMILHDRTASKIIQADPVHDLAWFLDSCFRDHSFNANMLRSSKTEFKVCCNMFWLDADIFPHFEFTQFCKRWKHRPPRFRHCSLAHLFWRPHL